jgi:ribosomal protein L11 methyltransferase
MNKLVVATDRDSLQAAYADVTAFGLTLVEELAPTPSRRILLCSSAERVDVRTTLASVRTAGYSAVLRPGGGPQLDAWVKHTTPITIGPDKKLTICFVWSEHDRSDASNLVEIDPDGGFGSGQHPATRLILELLTERVTRGERVLDVGCGSGVLALSALRLGAANALGTDIESGAADAALRNAELNGLADRMEASSAPLETATGTFDIVLANIGRAALVELGPQLAGRVAPGGWLAVAGFSPPQDQTVVAAMRPLQIVERRQSGEWSALVLGHAPE